MERNECINRVLAVFLNIIPTRPFQRTWYKEREMSRRVPMAEMSTVMSLVVDLTIMSIRALSRLVVTTIIRHVLRYKYKLRKTQRNGPENK